MTNQSRNDTETEHELIVSFEDGEAKMIRDNLRFVGSDAVFEVEDRTAKLTHTVRHADRHEIADEVRKLPFIDNVEVPP